MPKRPTIYYCPLEAYVERYTMQLSAPKWGWLERNWMDADIPYVRIEGDRQHMPTNIKTGVALDAVGRSTMCFAQISELLRRLSEIIENDDVIYFDDFWHPGIEAIGYAAGVMGKPVPSMYANLWAQSVDEHDFTYPMRRWMRHFEKGFGELLDGVFVACPSLKALVDHQIAPPHKVHAVGHPFSSDEVKSRMADPPIFNDREDVVVFSSRWDKEKNPDFFLKVVDAVLLVRPETRFVICSSHINLRSNDPRLLKLLQEALRKHPDNLFLKEGLSKEGYYEQLVRSKVQINTASQDWISYVLLEASCAGTYPVYPRYRSFPEVLRHDDNFMYARGDVNDAAMSVIWALDQDGLWSADALASRAWIHERFDSSWQRMAAHMGVIDWSQVEVPNVW